MVVAGEHDGVVGLGHRRDEPNPGIGVAVPGVQVEGGLVAGAGVDPGQDDRVAHEVPGDVALADGLGEPGLLVGAEAGPVLLGALGTVAVVVGDHVTTGGDVGVLALVEQLEAGQVTEGEGLEDIELVTVGRR